MFIRNAWYVAAWSREIGQSLTPITVLDEPIVLFRLPDGAPAALEDACPHRKLPLSKGTLRDGAVECGYHGLTFDRRGNLGNIHVPTLLLSGQHDRNAPPAVMKKMAEEIPCSTYIEMKGIGHLQNLEAPDDFDGLVLNFLALPNRLLH